MHVVDPSTGNVKCVYRRKWSVVDRHLAAGCILIEDPIPEDLADMPLSDLRWAGSSWEVKAEAIRGLQRRERRRSYPKVGDQLDAIWKQLNTMRMGGTNLVQDADDMLGQILAVKRDNPVDE